LSIGKQINRFSAATKSGLAGCPVGFWKTATHDQQLIAVLDKHPRVAIG
jgi:hypothetical protein